MKFANKPLKHKLKILLSTLSFFTLILFFQNCGQNSFKSKLPSNAGPLSENQTSELELPGNDILDDMPPIDQPSNSNENTENLVPAAGTTGKIYYVSTTGNNNNSGTTTNTAFRTIAYAVSKMVAGDTTFVRGGVYDEKLIQFKRSGTASAPIRLFNSPGESPVINCQPSTSEVRNMILIQNQDGYSKAIGWITIQGFEIKNCWHGINFYNAHNTNILRNWIHNSRYQGILGNGKNIIIDRNRISNNGDFASCAKGLKNTSGTNTCILDHGIYATGSAYKITNNVIDNNLSSAIQVNASTYDSSKYAGPEFAGANGWLIANNTLAYQNNLDAIVLWKGNLSNIQIINNIFYENAFKGPSFRHNGIALTSPSKSSTGIIINNNLSYSSQKRSFLNGFNSVYTEGINYTQSKNMVNTVNPNFEGETVQNYKLKSGSPAINTGMTLTSVKTDFRGILRPQRGAFDIGAYEF